MPAKRSRVASSNNAARQTTKQPVRQSEPNVPMDFNPQYQTLHEHQDDILPIVYKVTYPITGFVEYLMERPSFIGYNIVDTFDRYGWVKCWTLILHRFMLI